MTNPIIDNAISARYEDSTYSTILIEWKVKENGKEVLRTHSIPADPDNTDYQDLLEAGWTKEQIVRGTEAYKKHASSTMNIMINKAAIELAEVIAEKKVNQRVKDVEDIFAEKAKRYTRETSLEGVQSINYLTIIQNNEDKDALFQFKLWALELDEVKDADAETKKSLRKQTSIISCLECLSNIINKQ